MNYLKICKAILSKKKNENINEIFVYNENISIFDKN